MMLYRAEGAHDEPGYAGAVDERTGRYFGSYDRATRHLIEGRHLFMVRVTEEEALLLGGSPDDHVLLTPAQVARKEHSAFCPCYRAADALRQSARNPSARR